MAPLSLLTRLGHVVGVGEAQPPPPPLLTRTQVHVATNNDNDNDGEQPTVDGVDAEKQAANTTQVETGVVGIQAAQAIWGKHGRWIIIAG